MVGSMIALTSLALAPLVASLPFNTIGNAVVNNLCDTEVTLWTNGNSQQGLWNLQANSGYYSEPFAGSGIAIVLVKGHSDDPNGKYADVPKTTFAYSLVDDVIWYDLDGNAFDGSKITLSSADASCSAVVFDNGVNPGGDWTRQCHSDADVILTLCA